ncbi:MAG: hypothetical protein ACT4QB_06100 [Gammaproteobacteria bacterium]
MKRNRLSLSLCLGAAVYAQGAVSGVIIHDATGAGPATDACAGAKAHQRLQVPARFTGARLTSGSYYEAPEAGAEPCTSFVVEVEMNAGSNDDGSGFGELFFATGSQSAANGYGGPAGATESTCPGYALTESFYRKLAGEDRFTGLDSASYRGLWIPEGEGEPAHCELSPVEARAMDWTASPPAGPNADTYRVAVELKSAFPPGPSVSQPVRVQVTEMGVTEPAPLIQPCL